nr:PREDICTED: uncharacterized protein LOC109034386 [Bemisia tabaci]
MLINLHVFMFCTKKFSNIVFATVLASNLLVASARKPSPFQRLFRFPFFTTRSHQSSKSLAAPTFPTRQLSRSSEESTSIQPSIKSSSQTGSGSDTDALDVWHDYPNRFREFQALEDIKLEEGEVLFTEHSGSTLVAVSKTQLAQILVGNRSWTWTAITTREKKRGNYLTARFEDIPDTADWTRKKRAALMRKFMNKRLPYSYENCNEKHYMKYILRGTTHMSSYSKCPLGRDLSMIPAKDIESEDFVLQNSKGKPVALKFEDFIQFSERYSSGTTVKRIRKKNNDFKPKRRWWNFLKW